jgi:hypothetical protein
MVVCLVAAGLVAAPGWAKEGSDQYPNGAENWYAGAVPPAGRYYINYFGFYSGKLKNGSGANVWLGGTAPSVDATFDAFRFLQMTHLKLVGADYGMHVIVPVVHQSVDLNGTAGNSGIGDIVVDPFVFAWHHPQSHAVTAMDVVLPTGYYDRNDARVSLGANYYSFEPLFAVSYLPHSGWEASAKLMYNLKTTNPATSYHSGQEFHTDYAAGKHMRDWMVGGTGYFVQQTTDDSVSGQTEPAVPGMWDEGRRGRVLATGPSVGYTNRRHMIFMADWQHETLVANRFGGDKLWFKAILPLDGVMRRGRAR